MTFIDHKLEALKLRCNKQGRIDFTLRIEKLLSDYRYACYSFDKSKYDLSQEALFKTLRTVIKSKSNKWARRWNNRRLGSADFESMFYDTFWKLCDTYSWYGEFYFYETLCLALERKAISLIRESTKTIQMLPLFDLPSDIDIENDIVNRDLILRLFQSDLLTIKEKGLLKVLYEHPEASLRELAVLTGFNHHEQVRRIFKKINKKVCHLLIN